MKSRRDRKNVSLIHYAQRQVTSLRPLGQKPFTGDYIEKPNGFWVSAEVKGATDGWRDLCLREDFRLDDLSHAHRISLRKDARVRWLQSDADLVAFTMEYGRAIHVKEGVLQAAIHWPSVACDYQGLVITPHNPDREHDLSWYRYWTCSSGCIWDVRAIRSITLISVARTLDRKKTA